MKSRLRSPTAEEFPGPILGTVVMLALTWSVRSDALGVVPGGTFMPS